MVVAEAPSEFEDRNAKHLQGRPGKLFDEMLAAAGLERKDCYFTYVVKCHTPDGRPPTAKEAKTCKENYLVKEIAAVQPQYILTLGATALKALTKKAKITEMHGQLFHYGSIPVIPTFSPAMALRDPTRMPTLRKDFVKLGHIMVGNVPNEEEMHWKIIENLKQWNDFILEYRESKATSIDIETTGLDMEDPDGKINSIQIGLSNGHNYALPLNVQGSPWPQDKHQMFIETLVEIADETGMIIVGQNFKFDNRWIKKKHGVKFNLRFDTMLAHHILDENSPHGLKELASEFCNAPTYDIPLRVKLGKFRNAAERESFFKYGCFDVHYTLQLYKLFRARLLKEPELRRLFYRVTMPAARLFEEIEAHGMHINMKRHAEVKAKLTIEAAQLKAKLDAMVEKAGGAPVNWNAPAQVARFFFTDLGLEVIEKTNGGAPSTAETVMLRLRDKHPAAAMLLQLRGVEKNLSTYVEGWEKLMHGDKLFLSTKIHGTVTGRFSSRLHQVPRDNLIRSLIDAPTGWTFVQADYSQIELRIAAMLANEPRMKMIFQTGGDIHLTTASIILGIPESKVSKEQRKMAKAVNFGLVYGMGWPKLIIYARDNYGVDLTEEQAQAFRKRFFELYAALPVWHERMRRVVRATGEVHSLSGRVRRLPGINSTDKGVRAEAERQGINSPVQGFGSGDLKTMSMIEIAETFDFDEVMIKGEVHDSVLMWIRNDKVAEYLPRIKAIMESPQILRDFGINMTVPIVVDIETGPWGSGEPYKFKEAA